MSRFSHNIPAVLQPQGDICVPLYIPDDPDYIALLVGAIRRLTFDRYYQRDANKSALIVRDEWRQRTLVPLIDALATGTYCGEGVLEQDGDCYEYPNFAPFVDYYPKNPYHDAGEVPSGYLNPPFRLFSDIPIIGWLSQWLPQFTETLTGYQPNDVIVDISSIPLLATWDNILAGVMPQITINVQGSGVAELHMLAYPLGGRAIITVDEYPNVADIFLGILGNGISVELERDLTSLPIESDSTVIEEVEIQTEGSHFIAITFLPVVDNGDIPIQFGGGFRKVVLCGFDDLGTVDGMQDIRLNGCDVETFDNGVWTQKFNLMDCLQPTIDGLQGQISSNDADILANQNSIALLGSQMGSFDARITTNEGKIASLESLTQGHSDDILQLLIDVEQIQDVDLPQINLNHQNQQTSINDHETRITALEGASSNPSWQPTRLDFDHDYGSTGDFSVNPNDWLTLLPLSPTWEIGANNLYVQVTWKLTFSASGNGQECFFRAEYNGNYQYIGAYINTLQDPDLPVTLVATFPNVPAGNHVFALQVTSSSNQAFSLVEEQRGSVFQVSDAIAPSNPLVTFDVGGYPFNSTGTVGVVQTGGNPDFCLAANNVPLNDYIEVTIDLGSPENITDILFDFKWSASRNIAVYIDGILRGSTGSEFGRPTNTWNAWSWANDGFSAEFPTTGQVVKVRATTTVAGNLILALDNVEVQIT